MRDPRRIERLLTALEIYWQQYPDLRLGQIIGNLTSGDPYYVEDDVLIEALQRAAQPQKPIPGQTTLA